MLRQLGSHIPNLLHGLADDLQAEDVSELAPGFAGRDFVLLHELFDLLGDPDCPLFRANHDLVATEDLLHAIFESRQPLDAELSHKRSGIAWRGGVSERLAEAAIGD